MLRRAFDNAFSLPDQQNAPYTPLGLAELRRIDIVHQFLPVLSAAAERRQATPRDFRTPPPVIFRGVKNGVKSEISLQLLSVTSFSYTYFITYFISYFNENVLLTIIINRLSSTLKIVLINCQNFDLTNIYNIANLVQGTKIWNNSELSTPAYAAAAAYFGKTPPSFLKYGGVQHCFLIPSTK